LNIARAGALTLATVLAVMAPTAAHAASYVHPDSTGDVLHLNESSSDGDSGTKVPDRTDGDIVRSAVVHGKGRVSMALSYRDLVAPTGSAGTIHIFRIGTNKKRVRQVYVFASGSRPQGAVDFEKGSGKSVKCKGVRWNINYSTNVVRASVPRRCLGNPKWVHVGMATATLADPDVFVDDAATNGYLGNEPKWGARVYR
jgi:hypothetical protein